MAETEKTTEKKKAPARRAKPNRAPPPPAGHAFAELAKLRR